jgi:uncharacterized protein (TIGR03382 family)
MTNALLLVGLTTLTTPALAFDLVWDSTRSPYPGVEIKRGHTDSPQRYFWATYVDLCSDYIHVDATSPAATRRTAGAWASSVGAQVAVNGDFFQYTTPPQIYGDAVGGGQHWPPSQTGVDDTGSWYYRDYGWIAVGDDWVQFSHTRRTKENAAEFAAAGFTVEQGHSPQAFTTDIPPNTLALISGFPELVIEGKLRTCPDPAGGADCFGDRGDMRDRHLRMAMGITADRRQLIFISTTSSVYGYELAEIIYDAGAWQAFNVDGGGSTTLWTEADGYVHPTATVRAVGNHWGIYAGAASGKAKNPGSCNALGGCLAIPVSNTDDSDFADYRTAWNGYAASKAMYDLGGMNTCGDDGRPMLCPRCDVTRGEFAYMVAHAAGLALQPPTTATFADVPTDHPYFAEIEAFAAAGITNGCGDGTEFCVDDHLIRAHAAAFLQRAAGWTSCPPATPTFDDVPADHMFFDAIETIAANGVTNGCSDTSYCPNRKLQRGNTATLVARTFDIQNSNSCFDVCAEGGVGGIDVACDGTVEQCQVPVEYLDMGIGNANPGPETPGEDGDVGPNPFNPTPTSPGADVGSTADDQPPQLIVGESGCACTTATPVSGELLLLLFAPLVRRRRRR